MSGIQKFRMLIDGSLVDAENGETFESINPATGKVWASIPKGTERDVVNAIEAADRAGSAWSALHAADRARILRRLAEAFRKNAEALAKIETIDTGKLLKETTFQARYTADYFEYFAGLADKPEGRTLSIDKADHFAFTLREPYGVVAAIVPWNSQLMLSTVKIGPALAAGNTVVIKASEHASAALLQLSDLFNEAGFPPGVVNIVSGFADPVGRTLTSHPKVARISFTGGVASARHVVANSASNLAALSLELGGKSPILVFEDADFESAINGVLAGIFGAAGQSCVAGSRLYVHAPIADRFISALIEQARRIKVGDPLDPETQMGPLATQGQLTHITDTLKRSLDAGAKLLYGGKPLDYGNHPNGLYFEPTIVECPADDDGIASLELFGPVLAVIRFKEEGEAVRLANTSEFGLAAGVFTSNVSRSMRMMKALKAGIIWINTYRVISPSAEFGGFKHSGYGREGGLQAIYDYTQAKTVWINSSDAPMANPFVLR